MQGEDDEYLLLVNAALFFDPTYEARVSSVPPDAPNSNQGEDAGARRIAL